jgi:CRP-like cAMP-binding protein
MEAKYFLKGEILFEEGRKDDTAFVIKKGTVSLSRSVHGGWSKSIATIEAGGIIGEMAMIDNLPHSVTATATEDGEALILTRAEYLNRLEKSDKILGLIIKTLTHRLRSTYE